MIGLEPSAHRIAGQQIAIDAAAYPVLPVWLGARMTWGATTTTMHPDPARLSAQLWVPADSAVPADVGSPVECMVVGDPIRDLLRGDDQVGSARPYFTGRVDVLEWRHELRYTDKVSRFFTEWSVDVMDASGVPVDTMTEGDGSVSWPAGDADWLEISARLPHAAPTLVLTLPPIVGEMTVIVDGEPAEWYGSGHGSVYLPHARSGSTVTIGGQVARGIGQATVQPPVEIRRGVWRHVPGRVLEITASSHLAILGRTYIGAEPWPIETVAARVARISEAAEAAGGPACSVDAGQTLRSRSAVARDVDRRSALEIAQRTAAAAGGFVSEWTGQDGRHVQVGRQVELSAALLAAPANGTIYVQDSAGTSMLPASSILDSPRVRDLATMANRVSTSYWTPDGEGRPTERASVVDASSSVLRFGPSERSYETDLWVAAGQTVEDAAPGMVARDERVVESSGEPESRLAGEAVIPARLAGGCRGLIECVAQGIRHGKAVTIEGAPGEIAPRRRVIGGAVQFGGDSYVELHMEEDERAAAQPVLVRRASDWGYTFGQANGSGVTIADLKRIGI